MTAPSSAGRSHPLRPSYLGRPSGSPRGQYWPPRFIAACDRCGRSPPRYSPPPRLPRTPAARGLRTIGRPSFPHVNPAQPCIPGRFPITASERTPPKLVTRSVPGTSRNRIANQSNAGKRGARAVVKRHCRPEKSAPKTTPAKRITRAWFTRPASIHRPICTSSRPPRRPPPRGAHADTNAFHPRTKIPIGDKSLMHPRLATPGSIRRRQPAPDSHPPHQARQHHRPDMPQWETRTGSDSPCRPHPTAHNAAHDPRHRREAQPQFPEFN